MQDSEGLRLAQAEILELREAVANIRQEAEQTLADKQHTIQQVVAMREALEQMHVEKQAGIQQVMVEASDENRSTEGDRSRHARRDGSGSVRKTTGYSADDRRRER